MNIWLRFTLLLLCTTPLAAAPKDRIARSVDPRETTIVRGHLHRLAQPHMVLFFKPSADQQANLDPLLLDQQNPSSAQFRKWLAPDEFGDRFGLSASDQSKIVAWLNSSGFKIEHLSHAKNWVALSGSAGQASAALDTPIHRFQVNGETHFANSAFADIAPG